MCHGHYHAFYWRQVENRGTLVPQKQNPSFWGIKKQIPDITEKMLSIQLKSLEEDRLVKREVFMEVPLRVEYSMTEFGKSLIPILEAFSKWGRHFGETKGALVELKPKEEIKTKKKNLSV